MSVSFQFASVVAIGAAILGRFTASSPPVPLTTCVCRCSAADTLEDTASYVAPRLDLPWAVIAAGFTLGVVITLAVLRCWTVFISSLRASLEGPERLRRPRALAP